MYYLSPIYICLNSYAVKLEKGFIWWGRKKMATHVILWENIFILLFIKIWKSALAQFGGAFQEVREVLPYKPNKLNISRIFCLANVLS